MARDTRSQTRIQAVRKTLQIITVLEELGTTTTAEVSNRLDLPESTVYYHLNTLADENYVVKEDGNYSLCLRFLEIGDRIRRSNPVYRNAKSELVELADDTGEMCNLMVEENGLGFHLIRVQGSDPVWTDPHLGDSGLLHCRALGKAILAFMPERRIEEIIDEYGLPKETKYTITEREELFEELEEIRESGVAFDDEERLIGVRCVAAPIRDSEGYPIGSISVTAPIKRMRGERFRSHLPERVSNVANIIEINTNY